MIRNAILASALALAVLAPAAAVAKHHHHHGHHHGHHGHWGSFFDGGSDCYWVLRPWGYQKVCY